MHAIDNHTYDADQITNMILKYNKKYNKDRKQNLLSVFYLNDRICMDYSKKQDYL